MMKILKAVTRTAGEGFHKDQAAAIQLFDSQHNEDG
jgi:hypothetical protein